MVTYDKVAAERSRQWHLAVHGRDLTLCGRRLRRSRGAPLGPAASTCQVCRFQRRERGQATSPAEEGGSPSERGG